MIPFNLNLTQKDKFMLPIKQKLIKLQPEEKPDNQPSPAVKPELLKNGKVKKMFQANN